MKPPSFFMAAPARPRVVVTGLGLVTPLGVGVDAVWRNLISGTCGVRKLPLLKGLPSELGATVPRGSDEAEFDASRHRLLKPGDELSMSSFIHFALAAAGEALDTAGWHPSTDTERQRTGVAIGSGIGSLQVREGTHSSYHRRASSTPLHDVTTCTSTAGHRRSS